VKETATFVTDNLASCVGALWLPELAIVNPLPYGGPLNCFGVIDQANQSLDMLLQRTPDVPWTISPAPDCSITVGVPNDGLDLGQTFLRPALIPPCYPPETEHDALYTPGLPGGQDDAVTPPTCTPDRGWVPEVEWQDQLIHMPGMGSVYRNDGTQTDTHSDSVTGTVEAGTRITSHVEVEAGVVFSKAKAHLGVELSMSLSVSHTFGVSKPVPPRHVSEVKMGVFRKVLSGPYTKVFEDCKRFKKNVMIKGAWQPGMLGSLYPIGKKKK